MRSTPNENWSAVSRLPLSEVNDHFLRIVDVQWEVVMVTSSLVFPALPHGDISQSVIWPITVVPTMALEMCLALLAGCKEGGSADNLVDGQ